MKKLSAIVSDFDDTLFFNKGAISSAAEELYRSLEGKQSVDCNHQLMNGLKTIITDGKVPHGFDKALKTSLYSLAYVKYSDKLIPNKPLIDYIKAIANEDTELLILSARGEEFRYKTEEALLSNGLRFKKVILPENHDMKDEHWKLLELKKVERDYNHITFLEDKEENIRYIINNMDGGKIDFYLVEGQILKYISASRF
jgi:hypothetical protein